MKNKSAEQAKAEAEAVLLKAEKDSQQMFQTITTEAGLYLMFKLQSSLINFKFHLKSEKLIYTKK